MLGEWMKVSWQGLLLRGMLAVVFGIAAMVWPVSTLLALVLLWGAWAFLDGAASIAEAFRSGSTPARLGSVVLGLVAVGAAVVAFTRPGLTVVTITWVLGIWLIVRGVFEAVTGLVARDLGTARWGLLLGALLDFVLGVLLFTNPGSAALAIVLVLGITAIVWGAVFVGTALWMRRAPVGAVPAGPTAPA